MNHNPKSRLYRVKKPLESYMSVQVIKGESRLHGNVMMTKFMSRQSFYVWQMLFRDSCPMLHAQ